MLKRKILIVDDDPDTKEENIPEYEEIYLDLKDEIGSLYNIEFEWEKSISAAIERLNKREEVIDVLLIDYEFNDDEAGKKGVYLVKKIRETLNKRCKIIFYTMNGKSLLTQRELVDLINNDVYRFIQKSGESFQLKYTEVGNRADQVIVEAIIDALNDSDPISSALENYLVNYKLIMSDFQIKVDNHAYTLDEIINSIRLYTDPGNKFVSNLIEMAMLDFIEMKNGE